MLKRSLNTFLSEYQYKTEVFKKANNTVLCNNNFKHDTYFCVINCENEVTFASGS